MSLATATVTMTDWVEAMIDASLDVALEGVGVFVAAATDETPRPVQGQAGPYITLRVIAANDFRYVGGRRAATVSTVEVTAWDEGTSTARIKPIVEAVDAAIDRQRGPFGDLYITSCIRAAPVDRQLPEGNRLYSQLGGEYLIRASTD